MFRRMLFLAFALVPSAWGVEIHLEADSKSLQEGETVALYLSVVDGVTRGTPRLPVVDGLSFASRGRRQSLVTINGKPARTTTYVYALTGLKAGEYDIPAFTLNVSGQAYNTQPLSVEVLPRDSAEAGGLQSGFGVEKMWVGQTIVHVLSLRVPSRILQSRWTPPVMDGFSPEQSAEAIQREYNTQIDGQSWGVLEILTPLVATGVGSRTIPPGVLQAELEAEGKGRRRSFFSQSRSEVFPSDSLDVAVYPLPEEGRLPSYSGLVGEFTLSVDLSNQRLAAGESTTMTVRLEGNGTLAGMSLPEFPDVDGFAVYDDEPSSMGRIEDGDFQAVAVFKRAIVPEREGTVVLPPVEIQVFSPALGAYVLLEGPVFELEVLPGEGVAVVEPFGEPIPQVEQSSARDILPLRTEASLQDERQRVGKIWWAIGSGPLLLFGLLGLVGKVRSRERQPDPIRDLKRRVRDAKKLSDEELDSLFRACAGLAVGRSSSGVSKSDLARLNSPDLRQEAESVYRSLEAVRFGGGGTVDRRRAVRCMKALLEEVS